MSEKNELSKAGQRELFKKDVEIREASRGEWPKYAMASYRQDQDKADKNRVFLPFSGAAALFDSGHVHVEFGIYVLYEDFTMRRMTDHDQHEISNAAEEYSASK
jgi:hypothetical protein